MIANQNGPIPVYRGRILWMAADLPSEYLLPIDLKRQGRAEVHIPLFLPRG